MLQSLFLRPNSVDAARLSHIYPSLSPLITSSLLSPAPGACTSSASAVVQLPSCLRHRHSQSQPLPLALSSFSCVVRELLDRRRSGANRPGQPASAVLDLSGRIGVWQRWRRRRSEAAAVATSRCDPVAWLVGGNV